MKRKNLGWGLGAVFAAALAVAPFLIVSPAYAAQDDLWTGGYDNANNADGVRVSSSFHILPGVDNRSDLGAPTLELRDLYIDGTATIDTLTVDEALTLPAATITTAMLQSGVVQTSKILDAAVSTAKLMSGSVETSKILDAAVTTSKLASGVVETSKILDAAVTTAKLASGSVETSKILDDAVTTAKIIQGAVTTGKMHLDLPTARIACVTSQKILGTCSDLADANGGCTCQ